MDLNKWAKDVVSRHLKPDEELLWSERGSAPRRAAEHLRETLLTPAVLRITFVLLVTTVSTLYMLIGISGVYRGIEICAYIVFLLGHDYFILLSPIGYLLERYRFYGITSKRIIIVRASTSVDCKSVYPGELIEPSYTNYPDGTGDLVIAKAILSNRTGNKIIDIKLIGLRDAEYVANLITERLLPQGPDGESPSLLDRSFSIVN